MINFVGERVYARGKVDILTVPYVLVDVDTSYNILLGRPTLNRIRAIVSTPHLAMKFASSIGN